MNTQNTTPDVNEDKLKMNLNKIIDGKDEVGDMVKKIKELQKAGLKLNNCDFELYRTIEFDNLRGLEALLKCGINPNLPPSAPRYSGVGGMSWCGGSRGAVGGESGYRNKSPLEYVTKKYKWKTDEKNEEARGIEVQKAVLLASYGADITAFPADKEIADKILFEWFDTDAQQKIMAAAQTHQKMLEQMRDTTHLHG